MPPLAASLSLAPALLVDRPHLLLLPRLVLGLAPGLLGLGRGLGLASLVVVIAFLGLLGLRRATLIAAEGDLTGSRRGSDGNFSRSGAVYLSQI